MKSDTSESNGAVKRGEIALSDQNDTPRCGIDCPLDAQGIFSGVPALLTPIELAQFWSRVGVGQAFECWPWQGVIEDDGYGRWRGIKAHQIAHEQVIGPIPDGLLVCHHCDNPPCCNPYHLYCGTHQDNSDDAVARGRTRRGETHPRTKLTAASVALIRDNPDRLTGALLASRFGVSEATISYVRNRRSWKYG